MIFDGEIEKVGGFGFNSRISWITKNRLVEVAEKPGKAVTLLLTEQLRCLFAVN